MKKVKVTRQTKKNGSSKAKNGNGRAPAEPGAPSDTAVHPEVNAPAESKPKRRGRRAEGGEPLKRLLVFLSEKDIVALKEKADGKRGVSTTVREIIKDWLAKP